MGLNDARLRNEYSIAEGLRPGERAVLAGLGGGAIIFVKSLQGRQRCGGGGEVVGPSLSVGCGGFFPRKSRQGRQRYVGWLVS